MVLESLVPSGKILNVDFMEMQSRASWLGPDLMRDPIVSSQLKHLISDILKALGGLTGDVPRVVFG